MLELAISVLLLESHYYHLRYKESMGKGKYAGGPENVRRIKTSYRSRGVTS